MLKCDAGGKKGKLLCCKHIFDRIKANLAEIQPKNHQNVKKTHFLQKVPGVIGLTYLGQSPLQTVACKIIFAFSNLYTRSEDIRLRGIANNRTITVCNTINSKGLFVASWLQICRVSLLGLTKGSTLREYLTFLLLN